MKLIINKKILRNPMKKEAKKSISDESKIIKKENLKKKPLLKMNLKQKIQSTKQTKKK